MHPKPPKKETENTAYLAFETWQCSFCQEINFALCINFVQLAVALGTHILGLIIAIVGMIYAALLWTVLAALKSCGDGSISIFTRDERCICDLDGTSRIGMS